MAEVILSPITAYWHVDKAERRLLTKLLTAETSFFTKQKTPGNQKRKTRSVSFYRRATDTCPTGLAIECIDELHARGIHVEVHHDEQRLKERESGEMNFEITSDHQLRALEAMVTNQRGIIYAATNSGKTKIAEAWCLLFKAKVLYLVPSKELLEQTVASFQRDTNLNVGSISADTGWNPGEDITVCLPSSVAVRRNSMTNEPLNTETPEKFKKLAKTFTALIVDECHHLKKPSWAKVVRQVTKAYYRYGLSGTPWPEGDKLAEFKVKSYLGPVIARVTNDELIQKGWSAKPIINLVQYVSPKVLVAKSLMDPDDYGDVYDEGIVRNDVRNNLIGLICADVVRHGECCLIICDRIDHCEILSELLDLLEIEHRVITGSTKKSLRKSFLDEFKQRVYPVVISTVLSEGLDIAHLNALVFSSGGKSSKNTLQRVGRGIRRKETGQNIVKIYDFDDTCHYYLKRQTDTRLSTYRKENFKIRKLNLIA